MNKKDNNSILASIVKKFMGKKSNEVVKEARVYRDSAKQEIFRIIRAHPVSKELTNHTNPSAFLGGRRGTLFGFLGFKSGQNPVEEFVDFLDVFWSEEPKRQFTLLGFKIFVKLNFPTRTQMKSNGLTLGWQKSLAWPYSIESGVSNLPYYLYRLGKGRSGEGIQIKSEVYDSSFDGTSYVSDILRDAKSYLRKKSFKIK